jgi:HEAT repeat protein
VFKISTKFFVFTSFLFIAFNVCVDAENIDVLITELGNNDIYLAENAENKLIELGESSVDKLLIYIDDPNRNIASRDIEALGKIGNKRAIDPLIKKLTILADKNSYETFTTRFLRISVIKALGDLKDPQAIPILNNAKENGTEYDKIHSLVALAKIGDETTLLQFIEQLANNNKNIRYITAENLGEIGIKESINALIESLKDNEWFVRDAAIESLGKLEATQAIPYIQNLLKDPVPFVRKTAEEVLRKLSSKDN